MEHTGKDLSTQDGMKSSYKRIVDLIGPGKSFPSIKYTDFLYTESEERETLPDPATVWNHIDRMRHACRAFEFAYLFNCIEGTSLHNLKHANKELIKNFLAKRLGMHLSDFSILVSEWITCAPQPHADNILTARSSLYDGVLTLSLIYSELILEFFRVHNMRQQEYFHKMIKDLTLLNKPLGATIEQLKLQYRMQQDIGGTITRELYIQYSRALQTKFRQHIDTVEYEVAALWHTFAPVYSEGHSAATLQYGDEFMTLLVNVSKSVNMFPDKLTVYQKKQLGLISDASSSTETTEDQCCFALFDTHSDSDDAEQQYELTNLSDSGDSEVSSESSQEGFA
jgi:hypothetical protein